jgi:hypothetical protein
MHMHRSRWFMFQGNPREGGRLIATLARTSRSFGGTEQWSISMAAGVDATFTGAIAVVLNRVEAMDRQNRSSVAIIAGGAVAC